MKKIILIIVASLIQACAFTDAKLPVTHSEDKAFKGPIGDIESTSFVITELNDKRNQTERIGWKKNGYGKNTADILTKDPVTDIVANGISAGLTKNNHKILESNGEIQINGSVDRFWFEFKPNFWTVEFTGDIKCTLDFIDTKTDTSIYTSTYNGAFSKKSGGGLNKTWTEVMQQAVDNLIENIMFDEELAEALEDR